MLKKLLLLPLIALSLQANVSDEERSKAESTLQLAQALASSCHIPQRLGKVGLGYKDGDFYSFTEKGLRKVQRADVAKPLRGIEPDNLKKLLKVCTLSINKCGAEDYSIKAYPRMHGGGLGGAKAGFWIGKALGYGIVFGGVALVCSPLLLIPGAGPPAYATAVKTGWATTAPLAEGLSTSMAVGVGIAGAVATGPV